MIRKSKGAPFKLRGSTPFKNDDDKKLPDGVTTSSEDLGKMVTDENHLVNVTKNTMTTPDISGSDGKIVKASKERCGIEVPEDDPRCVAYSKMPDADKKASEQKQGLREGYVPSKKGSEKVDYDIDPTPQPGGPGDSVDPFTSAEFRGQNRLGKVARRQDNASSRRSINAKDRFAKFSNKFMVDSEPDEDGKTTKILKEPKPGEKGYRKYMKLKSKSESFDALAKAQDESSKNVYDQLKQGRNPYRSGEQVKYRYDMSKGSEGSDSTILSNEEAKKYKKTSSLPDYSGTPMKYGRKKSPTPFKLRKYN